MTSWFFDLLQFKVNTRRYVKTHLSTCNIFLMWLSYANISFSQEIYPIISLKKKKKLWIININIVKQLNFY